MTQNSESMLGSVCYRNWVGGGLVFVGFLLLFPFVRRNLFQEKSFSLHYLATQRVGVRQEKNGEAAPLQLEPQENMKEIPVTLFIFLLGK